MPLFSRRNKLVPEPPPDRPGQIPDRLRTLLWSDFDTACRELYRVDRYAGLILSPQLSKFLQYIWSDHWVRPADEYPGLEEMMGQLKTGFLTGPWFFPFDILELAFLYEFESGFTQTSLRESITRRLDRESSAYMLLGNNFVERMTEVETRSVESALKSDVDAVRAHFQEALKKLSDRQNPDPRNSIKESISARRVCRQEINR
jgi:AbiJ N-terminal domain 4